MESQQIMVMILDDFVVEENETLSLMFTVDNDSGNIASYDPAVATITILDFDGRGIPTKRSAYSCGNTAWSSLL